MTVEQNIGFGLLETGDPEDQIFVGERKFVLVDVATALLADGTPDPTKLVDLTTLNALEWVLRNTRDVTAARITKNTDVAGITITDSALGTVGNNARARIQIDIADTSALRARNYFHALRDKVTGAMLVHGSLKLQDAGF